MSLQRFLFSLLCFLCCSFLFSSECERKRVSVIVNPISGGKNKITLCEEIRDRLDKAYFDVEFLYTEAPNHATKLTKDALSCHADIIVAVGGDGLINEICQSLIGHDATLSIIPAGSGNGIARHLKIPLNGSEAIDLIEKGQRKKIDSVRINDRYFVGVAGIGFDAEVCSTFSEFSFRGPFAYMLATCQKIWKYKPSHYEISIDGKKIDSTAFMLCFANSSQFGNEACIAPLASINDGYLDFILVKKFPFLMLPRLVYQLFHHSLHPSKYIRMFQCQEIVIHNKHLKAHIDGEPIAFNEEIHIQIHPSSLNVLVPGDP